MALYGIPRSHGIFLLAQGAARRTSDPREPCSLSGGIRPFTFTPAPALLRPFFMPGRENNSEPCMPLIIRSYASAARSSGNTRLIDRTPASALKCLLRPNTLGSTIAGLIHGEGKRLIAQVVGNFAGTLALERDLCDSVGAGCPSR